MFKRLMLSSIKRLLMVFILVCLFWLGWQFTRPGIGRLATEPPSQSALMEQRQEQWRARGIKRRPTQVWVPLRGISPYLMQAVLIAEDDKFFRHSGFDLDMLQKAVERNLSAGRLKFGASTISQQLAKNLFLSQERSLIRKLREAILTWRLENSLSKNRILELYLNFVEWGPGIFGAQAASQYHFGRRASRLTPAQAARLAVVLPNPLRMSPTSDSEYVYRRSRELLRIMAKRGYGNIWR